MKLKKYKSILILAIGILIYFGIQKLSNFVDLMKFKELESKTFKTNIDNILLERNFKNKTLNLYILSNTKQLIEYKGLQGVGIILPNQPILIYKNNKFGCINSNGDIIVPIDNEYISDFYENKAIIKNKKVGVINNKGKEIIPKEYDEIFLAKNDKYILKKDNSYYLYGIKEVKNLDIQDIYQINKNLFIFLRNGKFGILSIDNTVNIPNEYDEISMYIDKIFIGEKNEKFSLYTLQNKKITNDFDYIEQIGINQYKGGTFLKAKYAFLSDIIQSAEKYEDIYKIDNFLFLGQISNEEFELIDLKAKNIKSITKLQAEKYLKRENKNE